MEIELVNIVGGGDIGREVDLSQLHAELQGSAEVASVRLQESPPYGLMVEFEQVKGTLTLFTSGKYNIMGCKSDDGVNALNAAFLQGLEEMGVISDRIDSQFSPSNYVYRVDLGSSVDLSRLDERLGASSQYEPEQNPFLIFRPAGIDCVMTISSNGRSVANSGMGEEPVRETVEVLGKYIELE